jgi:chorismate synthase
MTVPLDIRPLDSIDDFRAAQSIMAATWGYHEDDVVPVPTLIATNHAGGLVAGAFREGTLVAFTYAFPGHQDDEFLLYSQMTAVHPEHRSRGLGRALKLYQRTWALANGFQRIRWTFDPLMAPNARFNLRLLGARCIRYYVDFYGRSSSPLHGTQPTDRFLADWELEDPRVRALASDRPSPLLEGLPSVPPVLYELEPAGGGRFVPSGPNDLDPRRSPFLIAPVPPRFLDLCRSAPAEAETWRMRTRESFLAALAAGYQGVDFGPVPGEQEAYLLAAPSSQA